MIKLLSRNDFRNGVFERDNHKCVICGKLAVDAHHIMERRLFNNGGYFLDNGASLCEEHHLEAEKTNLSPDEIRKSAGIENIILPEHLYEDVEYDKWGNEILRSGERLQGELFNDKSVQKIIQENLYLFTSRVKYPRTYHLSYSPGMNKDDRKIEDESIFHEKRVIITEKMDGENSTWYSDYTHARSINSGNHPSRNYMKSLWAQKGYNIPEGWRVCGENLYAKHSIHYTKENGNALDSYFYMFSIWDHQNMCLSWDETKEWAELLDLPLVPVLYDGIYNIDIMKTLSERVERSKNTTEGYVMRLADEFHYSEFRKSVAKYVRANHVINNHGHWTQRKIIPNEIQEG